MFLRFSQWQHVLLTFFLTKTISFGYKILLSLLFAFLFLAVQTDFVLTLVSYFFNLKA